MGGRTVMGKIIRCMHETQRDFTGLHGRVGDIVAACLEGSQFECRAGYLLS